jgi:hypothetical protein
MAKDHDIWTRDHKDITKAESAPRPHADGCVGCRRASECVSCGVYCVLDFNRCVSGMCLGCCERLHVPHDVTYRLVVNPQLADT